MKVVLYMGISINGYIAKSDGNSEWTSEEDIQGFFEQSKKVGNIIMGKNTFREASKYGYFPFSGALNVVATKEKIKNTWGEKRVLFTDRAPCEILKMLEAKGFESAFLAGGGELNSSFMKDGLINEIYLDVEPLVFGRGIKVFADSDFEFELKLLGSRMLNADTIQLHYAVVK
ncbi:MAG: dihydrofolate reductase family protein [Patescibacteria group bacterium]